MRSPPHHVVQHEDPEAHLLDVVVPEGGVQQHLLVVGNAQMEGEVQLHHDERGVPQQVGCLRGNLVQSHPLAALAVDLQDVDVSPLLLVQLAPEIEQSGRLQQVCLHGVLAAVHAADGSAAGLVGQRGMMEMAVTVTEQGHFLSVSG